MRTRTAPPTRGFTLLELVAAIMVMSIIAATIMPVIQAALESYTVARQVRSSTERAGFALDRITRIVRQAPIGNNDTGIGITTATANSIEFSDGTGVQLVGTTLEMLVPGEQPVPLCFDVESLLVQYFADDGVTTTHLTPETSHRIVFTILTQGVEMSVLVHPRVWIGQGAS